MENLQTINNGCKTAIMKWLDMQSSVRMRLVCKDWAKYSQTRDYWFHILSLFWFDYTPDELRSGSDISFARKVKSAYAEYCIGTHFTSWDNLEGLDLYETRPYIIGAVKATNTHHTGFGIHIVSKGPLNKSSVRLKSGGGWRKLNINVLYEDFSDAFNSIVKNIDTRNMVTRFQSNTQLCLSCPGVTLEKMQKKVTLFGYAKFCINEDPIYSLKLVKFDIVAIDCETGKECSILQEG